MKFKVFKTMLSAMLCICFKGNSFAQTDARNERQDRSTQKTEAVVTSVKNPEAETMIIHGIALDKRIVKYYPPGELATMTAEKIATLKHVYLDSYEIVNKSAQSQDCKSRLTERFDLGNYNYLRAEDKRVPIEVNFEGCIYQLSLFSWNEVNKMR